MCGIYGWYWNKMPARGKRQAIALGLSWANDHRGGQAWGWAALDGALSKGLGHTGMQGIKAAEHPVVIGHTRWGTHGDNTTANAHPFRIGRITGAHNGVLSNHYQLNAKHSRTFPVDSQHLLANLDEDKDFAGIEGYGTLEWFDSKHPDTVFVSKMTGRGDLAICLTEYGLVWSSLRADLSHALEEARIEPKTWYTANEGEVLYFDGDGKLYIDSSRKLTLESAYKAKSWEDFGGGIGLGRPWKRVEPVKLDTINPPALPMPIKSVGECGECSGYLDDSGYCMEMANERCAGFEAFFNELTQEAQTGTTQDKGEK